MGGRNPIIDKYYPNKGISPTGMGIQNVGGSPQGASIHVEMKMDIPIAKVLEGLVNDVKIGRMTADGYYAILDEYEKVIDRFRNVKV